MKIRTDSWYISEGWQSFDISYDEAIKLKKENIEPVDAIGWFDNDFEVDDIIKYMSLKDENIYLLRPTQVRDWLDIGASIDEIISFLGENKTIEDYLTR